MNFPTFERAQVAAFAYREAHHSGSIDAMRAVCFMLRNRVRNGWGDGSGSWLAIINAHDEVSAHDPAIGPLIPEDRLLQMMVSYVDDIYTGQDRSDDAICRMIETEQRKQPALYWAFVNREIRPWFKENIIRQSQEHAHVGTIGPLLIYR